MLFNISNQNGFSLLSRHPGNALAQFYASFFRYIAGIAQAEADAQVLVFFVNQQNGKDLVIDDFTHQFCHSAQSGVEVKGGIYNVCHLKQKRFDLDLRLWLRQCHVEVLIISALGAALERGC